VAAISGGATRVHWSRCQRKLTQLMSRDLHGLGLVALLIDGVHFGEHVVMAAVGVDERGAKHVLGLREGATENSAEVLLADLVERGLNPNPVRCWS
jgi:putative transposase